MGCASAKEVDPVDAGAKRHGTRQTNPDAATDQSNATDTESLKAQPHIASEERLEKFMRCVDSAACRLDISESIPKEDEAPTEIPMFKLAPVGSIVLSNYDFVATRDQELSVTLGEPLVVKEHVDLEWWLVERALGSERPSGRVPVNHIAPILLKVEAKHEFAPPSSKEHEHCVPFRAGQTILVTNVDNDDWWEGFVGHAKGRFPSSYVKVLKSVVPSVATSLAGSTHTSIIDESDVSHLSVSVAADDDAEDVVGADGNADVDSGVNSDPEVNAHQEARKKEFKKKVKKPSTARSRSSKPVTKRRKKSVRSKKAKRTPPVKVRRSKSSASAHDLRKRAAKQLRKQKSARKPKKKLKDSKPPPLRGRTGSLTSKYRNRRISGGREILGTVGMSLICVPTPKQRKRRKSVDSVTSQEDVRSLSPRDAPHSPGSGPTSPPSSPPFALRQTVSSGSMESRMTTTTTQSESEDIETAKPAPLSLKLSGGSMWDRLVADPEKYSEAINEPRSAVNVGSGEMTKEAKAKERFMRRSSSFDAGVMSKAIRAYPPEKLGVQNEEGKLDVAKLRGALTESASSPRKPSLPSSNSRDGLKEFYSSVLSHPSNLKPKTKRKKKKLRKKSKSALSLSSSSSLSMSSPDRKKKVRKIKRKHKSSDASVNSANSVTSSVADQSERITELLDKMDSVLDEAPSDEAAEDQNDTSSDSEADTEEEDLPGDSASQRIAHLLQKIDQNLHDEQQLVDGDA